MNKPKTYRSADNVASVVVIGLLALFWMLSPLYQGELAQEDLIEFEGVVSSPLRVDRSGRGTARTVRFDIAGVPSPFRLHTYTYSALRPGFVTGVSVGDTLILGIKKDSYAERVLARKEWGILGGKYIVVYTVATPSLPYVTVATLNAVSGKDQHLGWVLGPLILAYLAFTWFSKRRLDLSR
jgi:hypothetical protein